MKQGFHTKIVGVTKKNADGSRRQTLIGRCSVGEWLQLQREPDNPHDKDATKICRRDGSQLGYVKREVAVQLAPEIDSGRPVYAQISDLTGGGRGESRGVNIWLAYDEPTPSPDIRKPRGCGLVAALAVIIAAMLISTSAESTEDCSNWHLQQYRIGMPIEEALKLHPVKKKVKPGSMIWKHQIRAGYEVFLIKNEPPDKMRVLLIKDGIVAQYSTSKPGTPNDIMRAITAVLGDPVWYGDRSTEVEGMGTIAKWENPACDAVISVSRVPTARVGKLMLATPGTNAAADTQITLSSFSAEIEAGKRVLD